MSRWSFSDRPRLCASFKTETGRFRLAVSGGAAEVEQFVKDTIAPMTTRAQVTTTVNSGVINTKALVPVEDLVAVGMFNFLNGYNIAVQSNHYVEW